MGKSIISMAMFNSYFDITRGYFLMAQVMWGISPGKWSFLPLKMLWLEPWSLSQFLWLKWPRFLHPTFGISIICTLWSPWGIGCYWEFVYLDVVSISEGMVALTSGSSSRHLTDVAVRGGFAVVRGRRRGNLGWSGAEMCGTRLPRVHPGKS